MKTMAMQMSGPNGVMSVPSEHLPGLFALVLIGPAIWLALAGLRVLSARQVPWARRMEQRVDNLPLTAKIALVAALVGAVVHAAIVPTHWGPERVTALLFIADTVGFLVVCWWVLTARRHWQFASAAMLGGTSCAYALYILMGWETMDLVGLLTTTIEAAAALVVLAPTRLPGRERGLLLAAVPVAMLSLLGTNVIASASTTTPATTSGVSSSSSMPGMSMPSSTAAAATTALSLPTNSPAGPIAWPDNMSTMAAGMKMAEPNCTTQPTAAQQQAAVTLVNRTVAAAKKYESLAAAKAAGYVPLTQSGKRIVHYINPSIYRESNALDPNAIPSLVYVNTSHGAVLEAAMYLNPRGLTPPQPGGCLTQWHIHTDLCFSGDRVVGTDANSPCGAGSFNQVTQPMMHVWLTPVQGGPLAPDPPALSEIQAAAQVPALSTLNGTA